MSDYVVIYETADDGTVSAYVPDLPIILASGRDRSEARQAVIEGIRLYREELELSGSRIPEPSMQHEVLSV
jgi:predicted RNase H-like HicB family nuclease